MEAICSSEKWVDFQWTTRRYIPEKNILHNHRCENLYAYILPEDFPDAIYDNGVIRGDIVA
jgi:hypothetical protein